MEKIRILCFGDSNTWGYISGISEGLCEIKYKPIAFDLISLTI